MNSEIDGSKQISSDQGSMMTAHDVPTSVKITGRGAHAGFA